MAKQKEKKNITLEEKLEQALVPAEEQPYEVPQNWCWVKIGNIANLFTGNSINEKVKQEKYMNGENGLVYIATKDIDFDGTINYDTGIKITDFEKFKIAPANTSLLCIEGGSAGRKLGFISQDVCFVNKLCAFKTNTINSKYIYYYLNSHLFFSLFNSHKHGLIGGVTVKDLNTIPICVSPLPEQQRIVDLIERLFTKLDEAKEKVQTAIDSFELRKAAILHKAFTGKLTAKWREENGRPLSSFASQKPLPPTANALGADLKMCPHAGGEAGVEATIQQDAPPEFLKKIAGGAVERSETEGVLLDHSTAEDLPCGWKQTKLSEIVDDFKYGTCEKSNYTNTGLPVLRIPNIGENGEINLDDLKYLSTDNIGEAHLVKNNDILIIRSNGSRDLVGKCALISNLTNNYAYASFLIRVRPSDKIYPKFLIKYLSSKEAQNQMFNYAKSSAGIHNINSQELGAINLSLPPLAEQKEIVRILDTLLEKSDKAKELAENALENIETLKKTILAKAFRGLLGTNRADEESSLELLKQSL